MRYLEGAVRCSLAKTICCTPKVVQVTMYVVGALWILFVTAVWLWNITTFPGYLDEKGGFSEEYNIWLHTTYE